MHFLILDYSVLFGDFYYSQTILTKFSTYINPVLHYARWVSHTQSAAELSASVPRELVWANQKAAFKKRSVDKYHER